MNVPLVVGASEIGAHAVRHLAATPGIERILVSDRDAGRADALAEAVGEPAKAVSWRRPGQPLPDATVVVLTGTDRDTLAAAEAAASAGLDVVSCAGAPPVVEALLARNSPAGRVVVGAGFAPGLSEVLAALAAEGLDSVDEVHVARAGDRRRRFARGPRRLVPFPPPVGLLDCKPVATALPVLLHRLLGGRSRVVVRQAVRRSASDASLGALHLEVRGGRGTAREILTYGAVDHIPAATGAILACAVAIVSGLVDGIQPPPPGARGFAELASPRALLGELARRSVRAARLATI